jgi:curved DNA-binding protein CbpA
MQTQEALRLLGIAAHSPDLTAAQLRKQYLRAALATHPDKNKQDAHAGQRFSQLKQAYDLLLAQISDAASAAREGQRTSSLLDLLRRALAGENVEDDLRVLGVHRPSASFGIDLAVPFHRGQQAAAAREEGRGQEDALRQAFSEAFRDSGLDEEGNPLEGWARPKVIDEDDMF